MKAPGAPVPQTWLAQLRLSVDFSSVVQGSIAKRTLRRPGLMHLFCKGLLHVRGCVIAACWYSPIAALSI